MANRKIAYTLGRGRAYISDMSSTSGYMGEKYFQEFGPRFFDMSSASGYMGEKYFQEFGPRFLACHQIFGVSCSKGCVSWRVNISRVNKFRVVSCQNSACRRVHAMSWPPCLFQTATWCFLVHKNVFRNLVSDLWHVIRFFAVMLQMLRVMACQYLPCR